MISFNLNVSIVYLILKELFWYLNFSARFMKDVSIIWAENNKIMKQKTFCAK
jgi:hypothetical protein